jgi:hypothetical protein
MIPELGDRRRDSHAAHGIDLLISSRGWRRVITAARMAGRHGRLSVVTMRFQTNGVTHDDFSF